MYFVPMCRPWRDRHGMPLIYIPTQSLIDRIFTWFTDQWPLMIQRDEKYWTLFTNLVFSPPQSSRNSTMLVQYILLSSPICLELIHFHFMTMLLSLFPLFLGAAERGEQFVGVQECIAQRVPAPAPKDLKPWGRASTTSGWTEEIHSWTGRKTFTEYIFRISSCRLQKVERSTIGTCPMTFPPPGTCQTQTPARCHGCENCGKVQRVVQLAALLLTQASPRRRTATLEHPPSSALPMEARALYILPPITRPLR